MHALYRILWICVRFLSILRAGSVENDHPVGTNLEWSAPSICTGGYFTIMATGPGEDCATFFNHKRMMVRAMAAQMVSEEHFLLSFLVLLLFSSIYQPDIDDVQYNLDHLHRT